MSEPRPIEGATTVDRGWRSAAALFAVACFASVTNPAALLAIPFLLLVGAKGLRGFAMFAAIVLALLAFMLASLILIVIPGSSVLFAIGRSLALGRRAGVLSVVGNTLGTVASWAGPQIVAGLLQRFESWDLVLATVAASNAAATLNYVLRATVDVLD